MQKIESFLKSKLYILLIISVSFLIWSLRYIIEDPVELTRASFNAWYILSVPFVITLLFFKNTIYSTPLLMSMLFTLGIPNMDISTLDVAISGVLNLGLVVVGYVIHFIKFKPEFKLKSLGLGLLLASISFIIPLFYTTIDNVAILLIFLLPLYLITYVFYANTIEGNQLNYLMRVFIGLGLMLSFQIISLVSNGFNDFSFLFDKSKFLGLTMDSPLWGNANDLTIQLVLMSSAILYYLIKRPKNILPWLYLGWIGFWIVISDARGSMVTITLFAIGVIIYVLFSKQKWHKINLLITVVILLGFLYVFRDLVSLVIEQFFKTIDIADPNKTLTGRITLWWDNPNSAFNVFKSYPIFGSGWHTPHWFLGEQNRITVYHSTFFQVLATGGVVGIIVLLLHFYLIGKLFKRKFMYTAVKAFLFTYLLNQLHGLLDNTQYMIHFSIVTYVSFAVITQAHGKDLLQGEKTYAS